MRTTLEIDDDILNTAKQVARQQGMTVGQLISKLARKSLSSEQPPKVRNGVVLFAARASASKPNMKTVNSLRDEA